MRDLKDSENGVRGVIMGPTVLLDEFLVERLQSALEELGERAQSVSEDETFDQAYRHVTRVRLLRKALEEIAREPERMENDAVYLVSASLLHEIRTLLTRTPDESVLYATGPEDGANLFAISRIIPLELAERSVAHASPRPDSQITALSRLDDAGERLLAMFHSHPGTGPGATEPSARDIATQRSLEAMGYPAIGGIVSRDGLVRFYSVSRRFRVEVSGAGVERVGERLFRLLGAWVNLDRSEGGAHEHEAC